MLRCAKSSCADPLEGAQRSHSCNDCCCAQVFVAAGLAKHMKEHQWEGVQFLWKNIYEKFKVHHPH